ncbi:MAG: serine hydrolase [Bacteroidia bacterium]|nr:serine hydrolase [Bacteroidia bacterium]
MKILKILLPLLFGLILLLYLANPQIFRIIRHQKPQTDTYLNFPQRQMKASNDPFSFAETSGERGRLDTLQVKNGEGKLVPFSQYFEEGKLKAFLVIRNDSILYEKYAMDHQRMSLSNTFSIGKSMLSVLLGKSMADGYIKSLDQEVKSLIPEFEEHPAFAYTSLDHLLQMKSGLAFERTNGNPLHDLFSEEARFYYTDDLKGDLLKVEADTLAGLRWKYSNLDPLILGWAIENAVGKKLSEYFEQTIWQGIGAEYGASWGLDHEEGLENTPSSFQCTAIDLAKIGRLYLELGKGKKEQILPPAWIAYSLSLRPDNLNNTTKGWQKASHQNYWWIPGVGSEGDYSAEGLRGQRLYVHPPSKTIIVQFAEKGAGGYPYRKIAKYFQAVSE